jgi:hypothetical protein
MSKRVDDSWFGPGLVKQTAAENLRAGVQKPDSPHPARGCSVRSDSRQRTGVCRYFGGDT